MDRSTEKGKKHKKDRYRHSHGKRNSTLGDLAIHIEEGGLESKVWYPELSRKFELIEPLLNELQIRFEEAPNEPLVERAISDLRVAQQEI